MVSSEGAFPSFKRFNFRKCLRITKEGRIRDIEVNNRMGITCHISKTLQTEPLKGTVVLNEYRLTGGVKKFCPLPERNK